MPRKRRVPIVTNTLNSSGEVGSTLTMTNAWIQWSSAATCSTRLRYDRIWNSWMVEDPYGCNSNSATSIPALPIATPEEQARMAKEHEERRAQRLKAEAAAMELLTKYLTVEQKKQLNQIQGFRQQGSHGGLYLITKLSGVRRLDPKPPHFIETESLCCHPDTTFPFGDIMLTQKLWIEHDEQEFRRTANITVLRAA